MNQRQTTVRPAIKICGLTQASDVQAAIDAGADMIGFVFDHGPCAVTVSEALRLLAVARTTGAGVTCVAVVGALGADELGRIAALGFDAMQMEASSYCGDHPRVPWALPAFFDDGQLVTRVEAFRRQYAPRFDRLSENSLRGVVNVDGRGGGGTGTLTDWNAASELARSGPLMLAGGLTADNVGAAIAQVAPHAVDVSSGVERAPGLKDHDKLRAFVASARGSR